MIESSFSLYTNGIMAQNFDSVNVNKIIYQILAIVQRFCQSDFLLAAIM